MNRARSRDTGFALLEVIVAMAIASIALATIYRTIGDGLRAASRVKTMQTAVVAARTHLDALGGEGVLRAGTTAGRYDNDIRWRLTIADLSGQRAEANSPRPYWIALVAMDRSGAPLFNLETARIAREAP